jgi:thiol-disulfide isomerase/thioredoxin
MCDQSGEDEQEAVMIRFKKEWVALTAIAVIVLFTGVVTRAETGVKIERLEEAALDNLLKDTNDRLVVGFMAAWCGPCIEELPILNNLYKKYKDQGIELIGISIDLGGPSAMQPIINTLKIDFPVYWYGEKAVNKFKLNAIPMLLFIKQGKIVERFPGKRSERFLNKKIRDFLQ